VNELRARLAARVKHLRHVRRLTQEQVAERAGLSYKFVGEIERGTGNPTLDTLRKLSAAFAIDVVELFGTPQPAAAGDDVVYTFTPAEFEVLRETFHSAERMMDEAERNVSYPIRRRARRRRTR
jgi:transcriptional regulator with XRE-family HTH domain